MIERPARVFPRRTRPLRPPRLGGLSINTLLPNMLTMLALAAGMTAMRFAIAHDFEAAVIAIVVAAVFDALDGRIARLLKGQSQFGAELDSLSDVVSFGVAPAITLYVWGLDQARSFGWIAALLLGVCAALRLARFNVSVGAAAEKPAWAYNYFTGVPAPAGAALALLPVIVSFEFGTELVRNPAFLVLWTVMVAALMISSLPTFSLKGQRIPQRYVPFVLLGVGGGAAALVAAPWATLSVLALIYLASLPFSIRQYARLQAEATRLQAGGPMPVETPPES